VADAGERIERVEDAADPRLIDYRDLRDSAVRLRHGLFIAESREIVRQLLAGTRFPARSALMTPPALVALRPALAAADPGPRVFVAHHDVIRAVSGFHFHRGCLAVGERGAEPTPAALLDPRGPRLVLVLDDLTNPDNVGGAFRNAMAFAVDAVLLSAGSADPLYRKSIRTSMGGALRVPFARLPDWAAGLARIRVAGYAIVALSPDAAALDLARLGGASPLPDRVALLVGSEGGGLGPDSRAAADVDVRIPMAPGVDSLNVATAIGIALHHLRRGRPVEPAGGATSPT
jgi:tRNA G18 (ribose-2'-O)-methylase SpoU